MCCSWLFCRRRVADSAETNAPLEAYEKKAKPSEEAAEEKPKSPPARVTRNNQARVSNVGAYTNGHGGDTTGRRGAENVPPPVQATAQPPN